MSRHAHAHSKNNRLLLRGAARARQQRACVWMPTNFHWPPRSEAVRLAVAAAAVCTTCGIVALACQWPQALGALVLVTYACRQCFRIKDLEERVCALEMDLDADEMDLDADEAAAVAGDTGGSL